MSMVKGYGVFRTAIATAPRAPKSVPSEPMRRGFGTRQAQWTCPSCVQKTQQQRKSLIAERALQKNDVFTRSISTSLRRHDEPRRPIDPPTPAPPSASPLQEGARRPLDPTPTSHPSLDADPKPLSDPTNGADSTLPSQTAQQRWQYSQRISHLMDNILARASLASQRINTYTGTDYTGIEALRTRILSQEEGVKDRHSAVETARASHREAHAKQSSAQKEIVSLLERKSSWSPSDLERYMGLVRSEHSLEADVSTAKDDLQAAERELEDARSLLERLERKQYHEEQIWSDTIRRNSTWVTFGLMGVNIVLLLAQIAVFEPYRRRKIVREVKVALDEKAGSVVGVAAPAEKEREVERVVDEVVAPTSVRPDEVPAEAAVAREQVETVAPRKEPGKTPLAAGEVLPEEAAKVEQPAVPVQPVPMSKHPGTWTGSWEAALESLQDLFSARMVQVKKVDLTTMALQGAATGVAAMGLLFVMFRPR